MSDMKKLSGFDMTEAGLLRAVLEWYSRPSTWSNRPDPSPYSSGRASAAVRDGGRFAAAAVGAAGAGQLLKVLCDAHDIPLTALGRKAGIPDTRTSEIATGSPMTPDEEGALAAALRESVPG